MLTPVWGYIRWEHPVPSWVGDKNMRALLIWRKKKWIWHSLDIQLFVYFSLRQSNLPFPKSSLGFSLQICVCVCARTSFLFGIPHLSSMLLPCFRPYSWLTCPSSSDTLNMTPPWNHQLGPVFEHEAPTWLPPYPPLLNTFTMKSCGASPTHDMPCRYSWSRKHLICRQLG